MIAEQPDGIIITISQAMLKEKGYRNWLRNFLYAMDRYDDGWCYYMRQGARPKHDLLHVYLCIGGKIRFRTYYGGAVGPGEMTFSDGKTMYAKTWIVLSGPVERPEVPILMKGFQGFRYTKTLF